MPAAAATAAPAAAVAEEVEAVRRVIVSYCV